MTMVRCDMTMSLDGYICGPEAGQPTYLNEGFFRITSWLTELASLAAERLGMAGGVDDADDAGDVDDALVAEMFAQAGAYVMGRRMFDSGEGPWGPEPPFPAPVFVVTHRERAPLERDGGTTFFFVTDGVRAAVDRAKAAAGDFHVHVSGGAQIVQQVLAAGLIDELHLHISPVLLGGGTRLFSGDLPQVIELERFRVADSGNITHLSFRLPTVPRRPLAPAAASD
jgi:dihydrofolate reductase